MDKEELLRMARCGRIDPTPTELVKMNTDIPL